MAEFLDFNIKVKRISKRQTYRDNPTINDDSYVPGSKHYYQVSVCISYIDSFINQLEERFLAHGGLFEDLFL